jgi:hypothetical protein
MEPFLQFLNKRKRKQIAAVFFHLLANTAKNSKNI